MHHPDGHFDGHYKGDDHREDAPHFNIEWKQNELRQDYETNHQSQSAKIVARNDILYPQSQIPSPLVK